jgi:hypothetical protein
MITVSNQGCLAKMATRGFQEEAYKEFYLLSANGKSGMVWGLAVAGVCFPLVNSLTLSEIYRSNMLMVIFPFPI